MTKTELRRALAEADRKPDLARPASRVEDFRRLATAPARGELAMLPRMLAGEDRRQHVRQTLREDHRTRIARGDDDAQAKFAELEASRFAFFRGTALLFYRDMAGEDPWMPTVLALGDVQPENFGVMPNADNVPIFAVNDFDEATYAPFSRDLKRGATGFGIAAEEVDGAGRTRRHKIARRFVEGYVDAIRSFARDGREKEHELRLDTTPKLIRDLIEDALEEARAAWLADDYLDEFGRGFRADDELVPVSSRREALQDAMNRLVAGNGIAIPERAPSTCSSSRGIASTAASSSTG